MDTAVISALSAVLGSIVGGSASIARHPATGSTLQDGTPRFVSDVGGERAARRGDTPRRLRPHTFYSARAGGSLGGGGRCRT